MGEKASEPTCTNRPWWTDVRSCDYSVPASWRCRQPGGNFKKTTTQTSTLPRSALGRLIVKALLDEPGLSLRALRKKIGRTSFGSRSVLGELQYEFGLRWNNYWVISAEILCTMRFRCPMQTTAAEASHWHMRPVLGRHDGSHGWFVLWKACSRCGAWAEKQGDEQSSAEICARCPTYSKVPRISSIPVAATSRGNHVTTGSDMIP